MARGFAVGVLEVGEEAGVVLHPALDAGIGLGIGDFAVVGFIVIGDAEEEVNGGAGWAGFALRSFAEIGGEPAIEAAFFEF